jgi:very-short-patch-repair endonuclease
MEPAPQFQIETETVVATDYYPRNAREATPLNDRYDSESKYKGFKRGIRPAGDAKNKRFSTEHGPVKVIFSKYGKTGCPPSGPLGDYIKEKPGVPLADYLRENCTKSEEILREALKKFTWDGFRFEHSVSMHGFVADFYCKHAALVVELDGACHINRRARDRKRDQILKDHGIRTMRFASHRVFTDLNGILDEIATVWAWKK